MNESTLKSNLYNGLESMFFKMQVVTADTNESYIVVFAVACAIIGVFAVFTDVAFYYLRGKSLLELKHGKNTIILLCAWSFGALVMGWLGQMAQIFKVSMTSAVLVGLSWPMLFTKYLKDKADDEINREPEQKV